MTDDQRIVVYDDAGGTYDIPVINVVVDAASDVLDDAEDVLTSTMRGFSSFTTFVDEVHRDMFDVTCGEWIDLSEKFVKTRKMAIVTTTINAMPNMTEWVACMGHDDVMIIAGDRRSPHDDIRRMIEEIGGMRNRKIVYLHPDDQVNWVSSAAIGWNSIQRRNIATLHALTYAPDFIVTIDDDNYPSSPDMIDEIEHELYRFVSCATSSASRWWNPGSLCIPPVTHRGFPMSQRNKSMILETIDLEQCRNGVFAALWLGDPDVDAIERIAVDPIVVDTDNNVTLAPRTWAPFNSQSTAYRAELTPLMYCMPFVGRMDDIWASYVARVVMDHVGALVTYGSPTVRQDRNAHDLMRDLENELIGYRHTDELCAFLRDIRLPVGETDVLELYAQVLYALEHRDFPFIDTRTLRGMSAWIIDLHDVRCRVDEVNFTWNKENDND